MAEQEVVRIFDTTLRDGEQSPGATMNVEEKLLIARQLEKLNVNVIEAGFAASSDGDFEAVSRVATTVTAPVVLSLSRTLQRDIERSLAAVEKAKHPGVHVFIATSDLHLQHKLMMSRQEVIDSACCAVEFGKKHLDYVEFSAEDASRSDREYLTQVLGEVIRAGAVTLNIPDTTGYAVPEEYGALIRYLIENTPGGDRVTWSAHCHNDLGMAVANSLAAVRNGARQIECTINGIGERAGNASMEEIVMAIRTRADFFDLRTTIVTEHIYPASRLLSRVTGLVVPANKPIVGDNAFAHEAGIHQDGVLKEKLTYEIMRPESVGISSNKLVLGKHSGRHAFAERLKELGVDLYAVDMSKAFQRFKALTDAKKEVYDEDILAIVTQQAVGAPNRFDFVYLDVASSTGGRPHAAVCLRVDGEEYVEAAVGDGMVDACYKAISRITGLSPKLERYAVKAITGGTDAQGEVSCLVNLDGITARGQGSHTDIIQASALAYVNALNKLDYRRRQEQPVRVEGP
jgi:2-isopropylmalate synthase